MVWALGLLLLLECTPTSYLPCLGLTWGHDCHKDKLFSAPASLEHLQNTKQICSGAALDIIWTRHQWLSLKSCEDLLMWHYPIKSRTKHPQRNSAWPNVHVISCRCQWKSFRSLLLSDPWPSGPIWWQVSLALLFQPVLLQPAACSWHRAAGADDSASALEHVFIFH